MFDGLSFDSCNFNFNFPGAQQSHQAKSRSPIVIRWLQVIESHGLSKQHIPRLFPDRNLPISAISDEQSIANFLDDSVLDATSRIFNVKRSFLEGDASHPYEVELLDHDPQNFIDLIQRLSAQRVEIVAIRSRSKELEEDWNQEGAIVLRTIVFEWEEGTVYKYFPVYSLQSWRNPGQRWLAIRALWIAHRLKCKIWGATAGSGQIRGIYEGRSFPELAFECQHPTSWHPEDYVRRPSVVAKGGELVESTKFDIDRSLALDRHPCVR